MIVYGRYWKQQSIKKNFGDLIVPKLVEKFGHQYVISSSDSPFCFLGGASVLHPSWLNVISEPIIVWGAGARGSFKFELPENITFASVRGPKTREVLGVDCSLGDPGFLMTDLVPNIFQKDLEPALVTHYHDRIGSSKEVRRIIPTKITESQFEAVIARIARSKFCLVNSLHAAIACITYKVPWALCPILGKIDCPFKWLDLGEYLEIPILPVSNLRAGVHWYEKYGQRITPPDLAVIRQAYPF